MNSLRNSLIRLYLLIILIFPAMNAAYSQVTVPRTATPPTIDGRVDDPIWNTAALIDDFFQREPSQGAPLTEKTEVFILYDSDNIFFGIRCYQEPETIAAKEMLRGARLPFDDRMHIVLDTYMDGRNAFFFEVNPLGSVGDALVSENGRKVNTSWEGLFIGKSALTDFGWSAELAIPFKTLSFNPETESWGLFMNRMLETKQEWGSWPVANINMPEMAVSDAGVITGLKGITQGIGLDVAPFAITGLDDAKGVGTDYQYNGGLDIYYRLTPRLKSSISFNTDFAEIEADSRQINLSRFSIRLPEKRNFFLDGADMFSFGLEGRRTEPPSGKLTPFFSRILGLDEQGVAIPINFATKISGRVDNWNIGVLHVNERRESGNSNSSIARISYNLGQLSSIGMITTYGNAKAKSENLVTGVDLNLVTSNFRENKRASLMLYGIKSSTPDLEGKNTAWGALITYPNDFLDFRLGHQQIGENFEAGLGFVPRTGIKEYWGNLAIGPRINKLGIRQISTGGRFDYVTNFQGHLQSKAFAIEPIEIRFNSGDSFEYTISSRSENLIEDFNIYSDLIIPTGDYEWWESKFELETSGARDIFGELSYTIGNFFTGNKKSTNLSIRWKIAIPIFIGTELNFDSVTLPEGSFRADIYQFNANILFSPNITLYNLFQFDSQSNTAGLQTRFRWILKPGNEILFVWNSGYSKVGERLSMSENSSRIKFKYNIRF
ncbi:MAG: carbohydrate binding family 9 domain-containing protein [Cyclobacteriaceae bacterium]